MANIKRSMVVMDCRNTLFAEKGKDFKITKLINTISYEIDQYLSKSAIDQIIKSGTQVTVIPWKRD